MQYLSCLTDFQNIMIPYLKGGRSVYIWDLVFIPNKKSLFCSRLYKSEQNFTSVHHKSFIYYKSIVVFFSLKVVCRINNKRVDGAAVIFWICIITWILFLVSVYEVFSSFFSWVHSLGARGQKSTIWIVSRWQAEIYSVDWVCPREQEN